MTRSLLLTLTSVLLLAVNASIGAPASGGDNDIRAVRTAWNDAYNAGDIDRLIALYTEDAVSMAPGAPAAIGRRAIRADIGSFLAGNKVQETAQIQGIMIEGNLAVERANYVTQVTPRTGKPFTERGKHIVAYRRSPDGNGALRGKSGTATCRSRMAPRRVSRLSGVVANVRIGVRTSTTVMSVTTRW